MRLVPEIWNGCGTPWRLPAGAILSSPLANRNFPISQPPDGSSARYFLRQLVQQGLQRCYGLDANKYAAQVNEELTIIAAVGYESYFLMVWDILQDCKARGIEWITRGSAADSLVCYCLGISGVCPIRFELYFKSFLNPERMALNKLPDIDIDFAHDKKDEVVELIFKKYGAEHCAVVGGFSTYRARGAVAMWERYSVFRSGRSDRSPSAFRGALAAALRRSHLPIFREPIWLKSLLALPECRDLPLSEEPYKTTVEVASFLDGFPPSQSQNAPLWRRTFAPANS